VIVTAPLVTAVTRPEDDTVATALFDDVHVAVLETSWVVPPDNVATAENCAELPTAGTVPVTATVETVVAEVGVLLQAPSVKPRASTNRTTTNERILIVAPWVRRWPP
jgi:hypothetical protein